MDASGTKTLRNPLSEAALTEDELMPGMIITVYTPGDPESVQHFKVVQQPRVDLYDDHVVMLSERVSFGGDTRGFTKPHEVELVTIGVLPDRHTGEWRNVIAIEESDEG